MESVEKDKRKDIRPAGAHNVAYSVAGSREVKGGLRLEGAFFFVLVTEGSVSFSDSEMEYTACRNDFLILTPSMKEKMDNPSADFSMACLCISPVYFDTLTDGQPMYSQLPPFLGKHVLPVVRLEPDERDYLMRILSLFADIPFYFSAHESGGIRHLCSLFLLQAADLLHRNNMEAPVHVARANGLLRDFRKLLISNYKQQHRIDFYANRLNVSGTYLSRIVKKLTGRTVYSQISELLCSEAKKLLECTDMDINEIADELGFSDQSSFGKFFLKKTGASPLKYRTRKSSLPEVFFAGKNCRLETKRLPLQKPCMERFPCAKK